MPHDVFLCHHSADKPGVKAVGERLKAEGLAPWLDEWELRPGFPWQRAISRQIETIPAAAVLVGATGRGPWQDAEMEAFLQEFVDRECPVIPVMLPGCPDGVRLPPFLRRMTWVDFRRADPDPLEQLVFGITGTRRTAPAAADIETSRMPRTDGADLFGREDELALLDAAWDGAARRHVLSLVAWGGVGKTALVKHWLARLAERGWPKVERVFAWSFYSQGTREDRAASADEFVAHLLTR